MQYSLIILSPTVYIEGVVGVVVVVVVAAAAVVDVVVVVVDEDAMIYRPKYTIN